MHNNKAMIISVPQPMNIVHIVRGDFTPQALNGVYKVIDSLSATLTNVNGGG